MALNYQVQDQLVKMATKTGLSLTSNRLSDLKGILFGGRGQDFDELKYLRNQNTSTATVDTRLPDAWNTFATGQTVVGSRSDQEKREFYTEKSFP